VTSKRIKQVGSVAFGLVIAGILVCVLIRLKDSLAWLSVAFGLVVGWSVGILLSPYQSEQDRFKEYLRLSAAFLTGYAVSKADRIFELLIDPARGPLLFQPIVAHRVLLCLISFFLAMVLTYVSRKYLSFGPGSEQPQNQLPKSN
jgi:hypothetical protein